MGSGLSACYRISRFIARCNFQDNRAAYVALDGAGRRHFLVLLPDDAESVTHRETRGLEATTERLQVGTNPEGLYVDLVCLDSAQNRTFAALVDDLLDVLRNSDVPGREAVERTLARWKAFWSIRGGGLSREEALGLFGELWFLHRWISAKSAAAVERWMASERARHDFQWSAASVEVKTAATGAADGPVHPITQIDQLDDPEQGELYLFSLQVVDDALAANTLASMVNATREALHGDDAATLLLSQKLAQYGYSPADAENHPRRLRIVAEHLYNVRDTFPRLTRRSFAGGLPAGVGNVAYTLAMSACRPWLIATSPSDGQARFLHRGL